MHKNFAEELHKKTSSGNGCLTIVFSDKKKFNFDGADGFRCCRHDLRMEKRIFSKCQVGDVGVIVWACISFNGWIHWYCIFTKKDEPIRRYQRNTCCLFLERPAELNVVYSGTKQISMCTNSR